MRFFWSLNLRRCSSVKPAADVLALTLILNLIDLVEEVPLSLKTMLVLVSLSDLRKPSRIISLLDAYFRRIGHTPYLLANPTTVYDPLVIPMIWGRWIST